jgi:tetratricopeptide (TPR) repeat protein
MRIRTALAELLVEGEEYASAAQTLGEYIARVQENAVEKDRLEKSNSGSDAQNDYVFLMGNFNYYSGKAAFLNKELSTANSFYMQAIQYYPENPDILIAMKNTLQSGANDQFYKKTLAERVTGFHETIASLEREIINSDRITRQNKEYQLAGQCNQLAWLLSSTNERPSEAVQLSLRSLELVQDYGIYQDTLARCYFAAGDIDKAIATQELAIKNEPFQRSMLRQLEEFKAAKR